MDGEGETEPELTWGGRGKATKLFRSLRFPRRGRRRRKRRWCFPFFLLEFSQVAGAHNTTTEEEEAQCQQKGTGVGGKGQRKKASGPPPLLLGSPLLFPHLKENVFKLPQGLSFSPAPPLLDPLPLSACCLKCFQVFFPPPPANAFPPSPLYLWAMTPRLPVGLGSGGGRGGLRSRAPRRCRGIKNGGATGTGRPTTGPIASHTSQREKGKFQSSGGESSCTTDVKTRPRWPR